MTGITRPPKKNAKYVQITVKHALQEQIQPVLPAKYHFLNGQILYNVKLRAQQDSTLLTKNVCIQVVTPSLSFVLSLNQKTYQIPIHRDRHFQLLR